VTHLNIQLRAETQTPDGQTIHLPPDAALHQHGPVVQVSVPVSSTVAEQLLQQGVVLPTPISGIALIDTGASNTCIDEEVAQKLGLPVIDVVQMSSASQASTQQNVYPVLRGWVRPL
jgi:hypothetical protein